MRTLRRTWQRWITPLNTDPDLAFRERTLRAAIPLFILADCIQIPFILFPPDVPSSRVVIWLFYIMFNLLAAVLICLNRVNAAALITISVFLVALGVSQSRQGYWSGYVFALLAIGVVFGMLIFSRRTSILLGIFIIAQFTVIALWQEHQALPYANPLRAEDALTSPFFAAGLATTLVLVLLGISHYHIRELNRRVDQVRALVNTLEERVAARTAELETANQQLQELANVKDDFVSNVSHELRTPITNLKLRYRLLEAQPERTPTHLDVIRRETGRLSRIIDDLLTLSRLDQRRISLQLEDLDLNALVREYVEDRLPLAQQHNITLQAREHPGLPPVKADAGLVGQALSILLTNALNYTPAGGQVTVQAGTRAINSVTWSELAVEDNGPGISPADQQHLFERFFRGEAARATRAPGTGLGLAILKEIVERHQGQVSVYSSGIPGDGTRVSILLPPAASLPALPTPKFQ
ncbi:MAG: hypothetical protein GYB65_22320 [Chloroflexi bacterium]|nr:hypothetical protein [Chloroflexota bacterium]